jgi:hypothetical protein
MMSYEPGIQFNTQTSKLKTEFRDRIRRYLKMRMDAKEKREDRLFSYEL